MANILDVARVAGVSHQTVSNVLNSPGIVRPETRERVQRAIEQLGYRPHASARRLRTRLSSTIAIRISPQTDGISGSIHDQFLHALTEQANARGFRIVLFTAETVEDEIAQFEGFLAGSDVDAFVLTGTVHNDPRIEWLIQHHVTFVLFGRPWGAVDMNSPLLPWVDVDGRQGLRAVTHSLLELGRRRIGFIGWPGPSGTGDERRRGWRETMLASGNLSEADVSALQVDANEGIDSGGGAMLRLLTAGPLDAVACASDSLALGALIAGGGRVPVVGFDNSAVSASLGFSSVAQPLDLVAAAILDILVRRITGQQAPSDSEDGDHQLIAPTLVVRSSVTTGWGLGTAAQ